MDNVYPLIVIGAGAAGLAAAGFAARLGVRIALVEGSRVGGDCMWAGCVPSKALLYVAAVAQQIAEAQELGLRRAALAVDLRRVMDHVREVVERVAAYETPDTLARQGIEVVQGTARFLEPLTIEVDGRVLRGRRVIVSTGARATVPPIPGLADAPYLTYETIFGLDELPRDLLVLGAGAVGLEMAQAFCRLGCRVTVFEQLDRILPLAETEAAAALADALGAEGIEIATGARVERVQVRDGEVGVTIGGRSWAGDKLLVAVGRHADVASLDLDRAGIAHAPWGIVVDDYLQTTQRHVYAAGDAAGSYQFSHYAAWQGTVAARNALLPGRMRGRRRHVPWVVFTDPAVAQVGLTEEEARSKDDRVQVVQWPFDRIDRAHTVGGRGGFLKLVAARDGQILGATVIGRGADEMVNELALAIERRLKLKDLASTVHAYPTYGTAIQQASVESALSGLQSPWVRVLGQLANRWP